MPIGHNCIGHNYIGHNYIGHNYIGSAAENAAAALHTAATDMCCALRTGAQHGAATYWAACDAMRDVLRKLDVDYDSAAPGRSRALSLG